MKIFILTLGLLTIAADATVLILETYETTVLRNLNDVKIEYETIVFNLSSINKQEAAVIKNGIKDKIITEMKQLRLKENIDFRIEHLDGISLGANLLSINKIKVVGISNRAKGQFEIQINVKEDISNRGSYSEATIEVKTKFKDNLPELQVSPLKNLIHSKIDTVIGSSRHSDLDTDYKISNLDLIKVGAKYDDYKDKIRVSALKNSTKLVGSFKINFKLIP